MTAFVELLFCLRPLLYGDLIQVGGRKVEFTGQSVLNTNRKHEKKRERLVFVVFLFLLVFSAFFVFFLLPTLQT